VNPDVKKALREVRAAQEQMTGAMSGLIASERNSTTIDRFRAIQSMYEAICGAREAQQALLNAMGVREGPAPLPIETTYEELD
jgi:hypothetical protein